VPARKWLLTAGTKCEHTAGSLVIDAAPERGGTPQHEGESAITAPREPMATSVRKYPVFVETSGGRTRAGFSVPANATPVDVSLLLRERGWMAYRVRADHSASLWIATIIDWKRAA